MLSVFLIIPCRVKMFNLGKMKSGGGASSKSVVPPTIDVSASVVADDSLAEKHPNANEGSSLRKRSRKETSEHLANASGSTTKVPVGKRKEPCEVEDCVGAEKYFAIFITRLKIAEGEDPLMSRWSAIAGSSQFWTEGPFLRGVSAWVPTPRLSRASV
ncbi:hypothetical protein BHE74_00013750 [Ensete ventricosum]|nr:hypothetical protein BHE74_00013750 [Ensete ventricosum]